MHNSTNFIFVVIFLCYFIYKRQNCLPQEWLGSNIKVTVMLIEYFIFFQSILRPGPLALSFPVTIPSGNISHSFCLRNNNENIRKTTKQGSCKIDALNLSSFLVNGFGTLDFMDSESSWTSNSGKTKKQIDLIR